MAMLGTGALTMWCDVSRERRCEFEDWHAHEHIPERVGIPGFLRGSRWHSRAHDDAIFVLYEITDPSVGTSAAYSERLNQPTTWTTAVMPAIRNMVRSACRVTASAGAGLGRGMLTLRLSPAEGRAEGLRRSLESLTQEIVRRRGIVSAHLLENELPADYAPCVEERMRGQDKRCDWVLLVCGDDHDAIGALRVKELAEDRLVDIGATPGIVAEHHELAIVMLPADLAGPLPK